MNLKYCIIILGILFASCKDKQIKSDMNAKEESHSTIASETEFPDDSLNGCDVSSLETRKEYSSDKREATIYLLWNIYRIQLLQLEERAEKIGSTLIQKMNSGQKDSVLYEITSYINDLNENKNALLLKPKLREIQKLSELMYCNYLRSIDLFTELKSIISKNEPPDVVIKNVRDFFKNPANNDSESMQRIGNEFKAIDRKYGLSEINIKK